MAFRHFDDLAFPDGAPGNSELVEWIKDVGWLITYLALFLYTIARAMTFILVGYSFWCLPPGVYETVSWSIPHWQ